MTKLIHNLLLHHCNYNSLKLKKNLQIQASKDLIKKLDIKKKTGHKNTVQYLPCKTTNYISDTFNQMKRNDK